MVPQAAPRRESSGGTRCVRDEPLELLSQHADSTAEAQAGQLDLTPYRRYEAAFVSHDPEQKRMMPFVKESLARNAVMRRLNEIAGEPRLIQRSERSRRAWLRVIHASSPLGRK